MLNMNGFPADFIPPDVACLGKRYVKKYQASVKNARTYAYWRQVLWTAAISRFKWVGLPEEIDDRYLEVLFNAWGCVGATKRADSPIAPYWIGRVNMQNVRDIYDNPNSIRILAPNGYQQTRHANYWVKCTGNQHGTTKKLCPPNAVVGWDNLTRISMLGILDLQAQRLAAIDTIVDQHMDAQRVPWIISVDETGKKNAEKMFNQIQSGQPAIYAYSGVAERIGAEVLQTGAVYNASSMLDDRLKIVADVYTLLGIDNNASAEKRERVQTAETVANNEQFLVQRNSFLSARRKFADKCNDLFGWDCSVEWSVRHPKEGDDTPMGEYAGLGGGINLGNTTQSTGGLELL